MHDGLTEHTVDSWGVPGWLVAAATTVGGSLVGTVVALAKYINKNNLERIEELKGSVASLEERADQCDKDKGVLSGKIIELETRLSTIECKHTE